MALAAQDLRRLRLIANEIRKLVVEMTYVAGSGHPGGSLSIADLLALLYFRVLRVRPEDPLWPGRDRLVLSKGHAAPALYAALALRGFFPVEELFSLRRLGSRLQGHPSIVGQHRTPGVEMCTGSLGHGFAAAAGMALFGKRTGAPWRVFVILGDGEIQEGIVWEVASLARHHCLDNLIAFVDRNMMQLDGFTEDIHSLEPLAPRWEGFGWSVWEVDGHDLAALSEAVEEALEAEGTPKVIIMRTVKGKGVSFMENNPRFHGKAPKEDEYWRALGELEEEGRRILHAP